MKLTKMLQAISKRFKNAKQELEIQTTSGIVRDLAETKGGHNRKQWNGRKCGEKRVKKVPYGKATWGTLGSQSIALPPEPIRGQSSSVIKQYNKSETYKAKINSRKWRRAAGDR